LKQNSELKKRTSYGDMMPLVDLLQQAILFPN